ncbi:polysaccharide deacetylase family protein [Peptoniphilus catoniae]|uniref:polysaccharide deacetylase family protein n=1 Tax=Peptoniphilus catoniae TaxID=1660341 RepID=UPI0010FD164F|nr:polysaccharide deacetylase [Peptoniphilus catoniae]
MEKILWPKGYRSALMLTFDVDGKSIWYNMSSDLKNSDKILKAISIGAYGPKRGVGYILEVLDKYQVKGTFYIPGQVAKANPDMVKKIDSLGHEIGNHGYDHERFVEKTEAEQIEIIERAQDTFYNIIGRKPSGFRTPSGDWANNTPEILIREGFKYSSSMRGDDKPYYTKINGKTTDLIEIPSKWEMDDYVGMAYSMYPAEPAGQDRISSYKNMQDNYLRELKGYNRFGLCMVPLMHPQVSGSPGRIMILEEILKTAKEKGDIWIATGKEISDWWRKTYPMEVD